MSNLLDIYRKNKLNKNIKQLKADDSNGVYFFLGNISQHLSHALPLWREIGGTFVVTSYKAEATLRSSGVPVICIDDEPEVFLDFNPKIDQTIEYLNANAKVVLMFDIFNFHENSKITAPTIMLTHGIALKNYWVEWRVNSLIKDYGYVTTLGPYTKKELALKKVPASMMIDLGVTRNDQIIKSKFKRSLHIKNVKRKLKIPSQNTVISYMPTYWTESSIYDLGKQIILNNGHDTTIVFWPHPQTPVDLLKEYEAVASKSINIIFAPNLSNDKIDIVSLYQITDVFIADMSSVILDILLTEKPLIFAFGDGNNKQEDAAYHPLREVYDSCLKITPDSVRSQKFIIEQSKKAGINRDAVKIARRRLFFNERGDATKSLAELIIDKFINN